MILGLSHFVLTAPSLVNKHDLPIIPLWKKLFSATEIAVASGKAPFMSTDSKYLSLSFFSREKEPSLELISYDKDGGSGLSPFQIVNCDPFVPHLVKSAKIVSDSVILPIREALGSDACIHSAPIFDTDFWFTDNDSCQGLICHFVKDLKNTENFWIECLGFSQKSSSNNWSYLVLDSPIAQWKANLLLIKDPQRVEKTDCCLDMSGYRCISFITSDLEVERKKFIHAGYDQTTGLMRERINNKDLALEIFSGPNGAMIELFQFDQ